MRKEQKDTVLELSEKMNLVCEETVNDYEKDYYGKVSYQYSGSSDDSGTGTSAESSSSVHHLEETSTTSQQLESVSQESGYDEHAAGTYCAHITTKTCFANTAVVDKTFLDDRCLENLLKAEERNKTVCSYFYTIQKDITPPMRKIVADWMMEVSFCFVCEGAIGGDEG